MKANEKSFLHFLEGSDKQFLIPVYQRNYDWKKEHCQQLFNDLVYINKNKSTHHFVGSIVSIYHDHQGKEREYLIIDGQQRITTLSLLLLAIYKILDENKLKSSTNKDQIKDTYLVNKYSSDDKKIRLKPVKNDKEAFNKLFKSDDDYIQDTNITINYQYFYDRLLEEEITLDELFESIGKLMIVDIELTNREDDPQLIFESLNSTGLDLSEADKVRNFVLMKEDPTTQEHFYNEYWNKIEENTKYNVSDFIRDYLTIKERSIPKKSKVYTHFKKYVIGNKIKIEDLLTDLLKFSKYYNTIISADISNMLEIYYLNKLETVVSYPFLMELFEYVDNDIINKNDLQEICRILVSFIFRRVLCDIPTNALNKMFMILGREIKNHEDYKSNYFEIFKYILLKKKTSQRFPNNNELSEKIVEKDIYNTKSRTRTFLLEQLENYNNNERVEVELLISKNDLNIEHIMPQTLSKKWQDSLGETHQTIHEKYLHTLGNITLTGYNSKMSNKPFIEKKDMDDGFRKSRLFLNSSLKDVELWNEEAIKNRGQLLKDRALQIWAYPNTNYSSQEDLDLEGQYSLADEDTNFRSKKIQKYKLLSDKFLEVETWKDFYKKACFELHDLDPVKFKEIVTNNKYIYQDNSKTKEYQHIKIGNLSMYSILDTETMLARLRVIIKQIDLDLDDLLFVIKQDVE